MFVEIDSDILPEVDDLASDTDTLSDVLSDLTHTHTSNLDLASSILVSIRSDIPSNRLVDILPDTQSDILCGILADAYYDTNRDVVLSGV